MTAWEFAKDFAGPIATVIAAAAALAVTAHFNRRQTEIASAQKDIAAAQRDIAADKLKADLFEKRYEIYVAAKALLTCAIKYGHEKLASEKIVELKIKLDEARFFFPSDIQALAQTIETMCEDLMLRTDQRAHLSSDEANWSATGDELAARQGHARRLYAELPVLFQRDLRSDLLAGDAPKV
jgi:hypothetical protein